MRDVKIEGFRTKKRRFSLNSPGIALKGSEYEEEGEGEGEKEEEGGGGGRRSWKKRRNM